MITIVEPDEQYVPKIGDVLWGAAADWAKPPEGEEPDPMLPKIGDVLWGTAGWAKPAEGELDPMRVAGLHLNVLNGKEEEEHQVIPLGIANPNTISVVEAFGIDHKWFLNAVHKDPYTGYQTYGIVPVALLTDDPKKYEESVLKAPCIPFPYLALDAGFHRDMHKSSLLDIHDVAKLLMGSGYSEGCNHLDGSKRRKFAKLKLSNGDWLYVAFWEWYNK